jgi:hypothetical protein
MVGSPPPAEKLIRFADSSFTRFPRTRWAYAHMRQLVPTAVVPRRDSPIVPLPRDERGDLDAVTFEPLGGGRWPPLSGRDSLAIEPVWPVRAERPAGGTRARVDEVAVSSP